MTALRRRSSLLCSIALVCAVAGSSGPSAPRSDADRFLTDRTSAVTLALPSEEAAFTFAIFGDRTGGPRAGLETLRQAVADVNLSGPDLVMTVGDLVQGYGTTDAWLAEAAEYQQIMGRLVMPWFPVAGNHDIYWRGEGRPEGEHESNYEAHFGPLWYAFEHKGAWFVVLYSDEGDPRTGAKAFNEPNAQRMSERQFAWLDETLTHTADARHVFVFLHHPRWLEGGYGNDWRRVHERLSRAQNVSAVFAGHIHRMRYDGRRDGIEYFTLGATGGGLERDLPRGGFLHEYHLVTVRDERVDVVALPVGQAIDPRALTGAVMEDLRALDDRLPGRVVTRPAVSVDGVRGVLEIEIVNPSPAALEYGLALAGLDSGWIVTPDHVHVRVEPGTTQNVAVSVARRGSSPLLDVPTIEVEAAHDTGTARFPLPLRSFPLPLDLSGAVPPPASAIERALALDGRDDAVGVASALSSPPNGPFTLECWMCADVFTARQGLVTKTESSEYGIFTSDGRPSFLVHLDGRYVSCSPTDQVLEIGRWHHVAGVFDGAELRLYVDGRCVARSSGSGSRTTNSLPLVVGGDVDRNGRPTSLFAGRIDEVRLSIGARYEGDEFTPIRRHASDELTRLLFQFDAPSPIAFDGSPARAHAFVLGGARVVDVP